MIYYDSSTKHITEIMPILNRPLVVADDIELAPQQAEAVEDIDRWFKNPGTKKFYYLAGFAGTGKTTISKRLAKLAGGLVIFATYTGKAARVLRSKGCSNACTIHSLIYTPTGEIGDEIEQLEREMSDLAKERHDLITERNNAESPPPADRLKFIGKRVADIDTREDKVIKRLGILRKPSFNLRMKDQFRGVRLMVLDECSMINTPMANDLLSLGVPILVLGDPGQLPPIEGAGYFTNNTPDFMLTEIHRQAANSPVIQLATKARLDGMLRYGNYGDCKVIQRMAIQKDDALGVEQIICGSNKARRTLITENRYLRGFSGPYPVKGEKLICLRNSPKVGFGGILNGQMFTAMSDYDPQHKTIKVMDDDDNEFALGVHEQCWTRPDYMKALSYQVRSTREEMDWGWAITGHKSQGSEWKSVLVFADMFKFDRELFKRWLYTAVTRASERVIVAL